MIKVCKLKIARLPARQVNCKLTYGFTLLELLIVITIIGVMASIVMIYNPSGQKKARDAQRKSDLKQYQIALETFATNNSNLYPSYITASGTNLSSVCTNKSLATSCPDDSTNPYKYLSDGTGTPNNNATKFVVYAKLENNNTYWYLCSTGKSGELSIPPELLTDC